MFEIPPFIERNSPRFFIQICERVAPYNSRIHPSGKYSLREMRMRVVFVLFLVLWEDMHSALPFQLINNSAALRHRGEYICKYLP